VFQLNKTIKDQSVFVSLSHIMAIGRLRKHMWALHFLAKCKPRQRQLFLDTANKDVIECICECIHNIAQGNVRIEKERKRKLAKHKSKLRKIVDKRTGIEAKRKLLSQSGGFLPLLLSPIIGLVGSLIGDAIAGAVNR
jgi:hypothetical protein